MKLNWKDIAITAAIAIAAVYLWQNYIVPSVLGGNGSLAS